MKCDDFRKNYLADPMSNDKKIAQHKRECQHCMGFAHEANHLENKIIQAIQIPIPDQLKEKLLQLTKLKKNLDKY